MHTPSSYDGFGPALPVRRPRGRWIRPALVFVSCALLVLSILGDRGLSGAIKARQDFARELDALAKVKAENAGLREQARRLKEDAATIEGVARQDLGMVRPDEVLFIINNNINNANGGGSHHASNAANRAVNAK
jgi:cell division protein FtsB